MRESGRDANSHASRRSVLTAAGIGTTAALAGCLGGGGGGGRDLRMRTSTETTAAYAGNEGIAAVVNDTAEDLYVEAQPSAGTEANIGALNNEEAEMVYLQNWSAKQIVEGEEPFDDLGFEMVQVMHYYDLPWFFCTANPDMSSLADVTSDVTVSPTPEGSGTAPALEHAISYAADEYDRISIDYGSQASAMNEDRLDVGVATYMNFEIVPGWTQEMMSTVDLRVLEIEDGILDRWEDDGRLLVQSFPGEDLENAASVPNEVHTPTFAYNFVSRADLDYDLVYDYLSTLYENRQELEDYHAVLGKLEGEEFWTENMYDDVPFHAAAADFYEEEGLWRDEFERAEEQ